jgi:hypothetical protein
MVILSQAQISVAENLAKMSWCLFLLPGFFSAIWIDLV